MKIQVQHFYDVATSTLTYIVYDEETKDAVILDPVLDFDLLSCQVRSDSFQNLSTFIENSKLRLHFVLETHAHADHLSSAQWIKSKFKNVKIGIGSKIKIVQQTFKEIFAWADLKTDGSQFDVLGQDNDVLKAGSLSIKTLELPGHTPSCVGYKIADLLFVGDCLFMPDLGTGRCDFPGGDAHQLFHSVTEKIYTLPESTRIFVGHDYPPQSRQIKFETSVKEQKNHNIHISQSTKIDEFVKMRTTRDKTLSAPKLFYPSIQVNINAGFLPAVFKKGVA